MHPALLHQPRVSRRPAVPDALPLPMSRTEMEARGWDEVDIVFVSGDAYVDHPSFAMAILGRVLESAGFRVGDAVPARLAERANRGAPSGRRGCSSPSAPATWIP